MVAIKKKPARAHERTNLLGEDPLTFSGAWMSVIYDLITAQGAELASEIGAATPARCFSVFLAISRHGPVSIADLARLHGFSHQLMRTRLIELENAGLVESVASREDARKVTLRLTSVGRADLPKVNKICAKARIALRQVFEEAGLDAAALPRLADALRRRPLRGR